jgi:single-stranded-DNA-specific exonuclease
MMKRFGGHKAAAGLQIETSRIKEFRAAINAHADARLGPDDLRPSLWLDGPLAFSELNERVMHEFAALAPFGPGNPRPRFHTNQVAVVDGPRILKERHLKLSVKQNGRVLRAIQWNAADREAHLVAKKDAVEIAYTVEENEYMGNKYVELRLDDFR